MLAGRYYKVTLDNLGVVQEHCLERGALSYIVSSLNLVTHSVKITVVIHAFLLTLHKIERLCGSIFLKQRGFLALPITKGVSNSPKLLTQKATVSLSLDFFTSCTVTSLYY